MRKVVRTSPPIDLLNNQASWTVDFIDEIKRNRGYTGINKQIRDRYNTVQVKHALKQMYKGKCCYCENKIGIEGYEKIEHLKPKSKPNFHMIAFEWNNLHWCCERCNKKKQAKWNAHYPIINPVKDNPKNHMKLDVIKGELIALTRRGRVTINHPQLNREELVGARKAILNKLNSIHHLVLSTPTLKDDKYFEILLAEFVREDIEFSYLMEQYIEEWDLT